MSRGARINVDLLVKQTSDSIGACVVVCFVIYLSELTGSENTHIVPF